MSEQNAGSGSRKSSQTIIIVALVAFVLCACLAVTGVIAWSSCPSTPSGYPYAAQASVVTVAATPIKQRRHPLATVIVGSRIRPLAYSGAAANLRPRPCKATAAAPTPQPAARVTAARRRAIL
jgi:hypothetical protein